MGFDFSADPRLLATRKRDKMRLKFSLSRVQYEALMLVASEGAETSMQPRHVVEKSRMAVAQMKRQDERQKMKKGS